MTRGEEGTGRGSGGGGEERGGVGRGGEGGAGGERRQKECIWEGEVGAKGWGRGAGG